MTKNRENSAVETIEIVSGAAIRAAINRKTRETKMEYLDTYTFDKSDSYESIFETFGKIKNFLKDYESKDIVFDISVSAYTNSAYPLDSIGDAFGKDLTDRLFDAATRIMFYLHRRGYSENVAHLAIYRREPENREN